MQVSPKLNANLRPLPVKGIVMPDKLRLFLISILWLLLAACATAPKDTTSAAQPETVPDFALPDQNGRTVRLSEVLENQNGAVIAFYPKDDTRN